VSAAALVPLTIEDGESEVGCHAAVPRRGTRPQRAGPARPARPPRRQPRRRGGQVRHRPALRLTRREPDQDHPYGHEKFETLGALAIVVFLSITGFELVENAIGRLKAGSPPLEITNLELALLAGTLAINIAVTTYETNRGRALGSAILLADAAHTRADVFVTIGVLIGVVAGRYGFGIVDPIMALGVAGLIVVLAYRIVARSVPDLVDQLVVPPDDIRELSETVAGVVRAYDIRSRGTQERRFAELTVAVDGRATVEAAHEIADAVEAKLRHDLGFHEVIVHVEPC
jgi:cation diffusion facilitator family transporter